eukprot:5481653-Prymnesium_polylepis.2
MGGELEEGRTGERVKGSAEGRARGGVGAWKKESLRKMDVSLWRAKWGRSMACASTGTRTNRITWPPMSAT